MLITPYQHITNGQKMKLTCISLHLHETGTYNVPYQCDIHFLQKTYEVRMGN